MELSIVTTLYCSELYIEEFYRRISAAAERITGNFEIIFVNDGSPDNSLEVACALADRDSRVRVIDLSRNFGHHRAMMTGLADANGDLIFLIDSDLEEEPELLLKFHCELRHTAADVVFGQQVSRKGGLLERITGTIFYTTFKLLADAPVPDNLVTVRLMTARYVSSLVRHRDKEIFLAGLWQITGFRQVPLTVHKHSKGVSSYNFRRKVTIFVNAITSFSNKPLVFIFYLGIAIMGLSTAAALYLIIRRLFFGILLFGWPSLIVSVWMMGGLTIFSLGVIGIYISKIFTETKDRPYTIIRNVYSRMVGRKEGIHEERVRPL
jgi:putative glycosyltransferase